MPSNFLLFSHWVTSGQESSAQYFSSFPPSINSARTARPFKTKQFTHILPSITLKNLCVIDFQGNTAFSLVPKHVRAQLDQAKCPSSTGSFISQLSTLQDASECTQDHKKNCILYSLASGIQIYPTSRSRKLHILSTPCNL